MGSFDRYVVVRALSCVPNRVKIVRDTETSKIFVAKLFEVIPSAVEFQLRRFRDELSAHTALQHLNLIELVGSSESSRYFPKEKQPFNCMFLILELCENGNLNDVLSQRPDFQEFEVLFFFEQLLSAVCYMHEHGFAHWGLCPENILFDQDLTVKICNFRMSKKLVDSTTQMAPKTLKVGSCYAPELYRNIQTADQAADVYSLGVLLFILFADRPPFQTVKAPQYLTFKNNKTEFWRRYGAKVPEGPRGLIERMIVEDPAHRISLSEVLESPWLNNGRGGGIDLDALRANIAAKAKEAQRAALHLRQQLSEGNSLYRAASEISPELHLRSVDRLRVKKFYEITTGLPPPEVSKIIVSCLAAHSANSSVKPQEIWSSMVTDNEGTLEVKIKFYLDYDDLLLVCFMKQAGTEAELRALVEEVSGKLTEEQDRCLAPLTS